MKKISMKFVLACTLVLALGLVANTASAQCTTCAVPQVTYSPVVYNTYQYDGWYLGKYVGQLGRRVFGTAPAPAYTTGYPTTYAAGYAPTYTYAASYAPTYSYATSYAPACSTCGTGSCGCQTTYRPVTMQPLSSCSSCSGVVQAGYNAPSCPSCATGTTTTAAPTNDYQPTLAPQRTFQETQRLEPTPAAETSNESSTTELNAPLLLNPNDQITKRPTSPVWTAVYKSPATITSVRATQQPSDSEPLTIGWKAGR